MECSLFFFFPLLNVNQININQVCVTRQQADFFKVHGWIYSYKSFPSVITQNVLTARITGLLQAVCRGCVGAIVGDGVCSPGNLCQKNSVLNGQPAGSAFCLVRNLPGVSIPNLMLHSPAPLKTICVILKFP